MTAAATAVITQMFYQKSLSVRERGLRQRNKFENLIVIKMFAICKCLSSGKTK